MPIPSVEMFVVKHVILKGRTQAQLREQLDAEPVRKWVRSFLVGGCNVTMCLRENEGVTAYWDRQPVDISKTAREHYNLERAKLFAKFAEDADTGVVLMDRPTPPHGTDPRRMPEE